LWQGFNSIKSLASGNVQLAKQQYAEFQRGKRAVFANGEESVAIKNERDANTQYSDHTPNEHWTPQQIMGYFKMKGKSTDEAAAWAAIFQSESGGNSYNPGDYNPKTGKYEAQGVAQWHPDRQAAFKNWSGHDIGHSTMSEQLDFAEYEHTQGNFANVGRTLDKTKGAGPKAKVISNNYEIPDDPTGSKAAERAKLAESLARQWGGSSGDYKPPINPTWRGTFNTAVPAQMHPMSYNTSSQDRTVNIERIVINTQATDAHGIAREVRSAFNYTLTAQTNTGIA